MRLWYCRKTKRTHAFASRKRLECTGLKTTQRVCSYHKAKAKCYRNMTSNEVQIIFIHDIEMVYSFCTQRSFLGLPWSDLERKYTKDTTQDLLTQLWLENKQMHVYQKPWNTETVSFIHDSWFCRWRITTVEITQFLHISLRSISVSWKSSYHQLLFQQPQQSCLHDLPCSCCEPGNVKTDCDFCCFFPPFLKPYTACNRSYS